MDMEEKITDMDKTPQEIAMEKTLLYYTKKLIDSSALIKLEFGMGDLKEMLENHSEKVKVDGEEDQTQLLFDEDDFKKFTDKLESTKEAYEESKKIIKEMKESLDTIDDIRKDLENEDE